MKRHKASKKEHSSRTGSSTYYKTERGVVMQEQEFDMVVTEYRGRMIWETLARLFADQTGQEVERITYPNQNREIPSEVPKKVV